MNAKYIVIIAFLAFIFGAFVGNCDGDRATVKQCMETGEAKLVDGFKIKCDLVPLTN